MMPLDELKAMHASPCCCVVIAGSMAKCNRCVALHNHFPAIIARLERAEAVLAETPCSCVGVFNREGRLEHRRCNRCSVLADADKPLELTAETQR